jgi:hypothetical protein
MRSAIGRAMAVAVLYCGSTAIVMLAFIGPGGTPEAPFVEYWILWTAIFAPSAFVLGILVMAVDVHAVRQRLATAASLAVIMLAMVICLALNVHFAIALGTVVVLCISVFAVFRLAG